VRANLAGADLTRDWLIEAHLVGANLTGARLTGARLTGAKLRGANLTGADLTRTLYDRRTEWPDGFAPRAHGAFLVAPGVDGHGASLPGALLFSVNLEGA